MTNIVGTFQTVIKFVAFFSGKVGTCALKAYPFSPEEWVILTEHCRAFALHLQDENAGEGIYLQGN